MDLSNCRIFGCKAYAKELGNLKKLDERSKQLIFVGYSPGGYRLWDASKRKIVVRRDVESCEKENLNQRKKINPEETDEEEEKEVEKEDTVSEEEDERDIALREEKVEETQERIEEVEQIDDMQTTDYTETDEEPSETHQPVTTKQRRSTKEEKRPMRYKEYVLLTYHEAVTGPHSRKWEEAIKAEKESLRKNTTWELVDKEEVGKKKILSNKWI